MYMYLICIWSVALLPLATDADVSTCVDRCSKGAIFFLIFLIVLIFFLGRIYYDMYGRLMVQYIIYLSNIRTYSHSHSHYYCLSLLLPLITTASHYYCLSYTFPLTASRCLSLLLPLITTASHYYCLSLLLPLFTTAGTSIVRNSTETKPWSGLLSLSEFVRVFRV